MGATTAARTKRTKDKLMPLVGLCKFLSSPKRLRILIELADGPMIVTELSSRTRLRPPLVSKTLSRMRALGLVSMEVDGLFHYYGLTKAATLRRHRGGVTLTLATASGKVALFWRP